MAPSFAVLARGLVKRYGDFTALSGLDLTIERGAFYAFLGPNGAGKSTTIGLLTGVLAKDAGRLEILGVDAASHALALKSRLGAVPEELALFERLTGRQHLTFCARMYGLSGAVADARAGELLELTELAPHAGALVAEYSKGMRRRLAIASALIHAPELLLLDEPFEGIDVVASAVIRALLQELSRRGVTVLLTTHVLEIAEKLSTHAGIVREGRMLLEGAVPDLLARSGARSLEEVFQKQIGAPAAASAPLSFYPSYR